MNIGSNNNGVARNDLKGVSGISPGNIKAISNNVMELNHMAMSHHLLHLNNQIHQPK